MTALNLTRRNSEDARVLRPDAPGLIWATAVGVVVILGAAFLISFQSLTAVAVASRIPEWIAPAFPVAVDGLIAVATFAAVILEPRSRALRVYGFLVLALGASISIWANGLHSAGTDHLDPSERWIVGATAPVALVLGTHLLTLLLKPAVRPLSDLEIRQQIEVEFAAQRKAEAAAARAAAAADVLAAEVVVTPTVRALRKPAVLGSRADVIAVIDRLAATAGVRPSIPLIVTEAKCSESTAKRARSEWESAQAD
ncbi:DUF2637 domain-containing protein [Leifsonia sp. Leaf264]|uniref:DUF2637 domain-containing protein n=1 Tax=Leifsonia sp. Leaf264 TaxID=1736314 RepID=UPI0006FB10C0|nr:DUF2637 domain-containing protein [Leifsonia sp. Leaf264]KQP01433.1 hypothetical protein ASF30_02105 [Leifsonia sp. Leaf264]